MLRNNDKTSKKILVYSSAVILMFFIPVAVMLIRDLDNDTWFMLNHGRYILQNGLYPEYEPFTVHSELHFTFQKWLACVIYWIIYKYTGAIGLKLFNAAIYCLFDLVLYRLLNYVAQDKSRIHNLVIIVLMNALMYQFYYVRPQIFTYLFLAIELLCLEKYIKEKQSKYLIVIPFLSLAEIQLHSTIWPILLIFMLPYMFDFSSMKIAEKIKFIERREYNRINIWITFAASIVAALINPYGSESLIYLVKSLFIPELKLSIPEVRAPGLLSITTFSIIIFSILLIIYLIKNRKFELRFLFLYAGTMLMAIMSTRQLSFFLIAGAVLVCNQRKIKLTNIKQIFIVLLAFIISIEVAFVTYEYPSKHNQCIVNVVDYLDSIESGENVKVFSISDPGSYLEFKGFKTYSDTRAEIFSDKINLKKNILEERANYELGYLNYKDLFTKYDFDYAIIYNTEKQYPQICADENTTLLYENEMFSLFSLNFE